MQKSEINYLVIQSTYQEIEVALFRNSNCIAVSSISKLEASSKLIPKIETLLAELSLTINDLDFIGSNQGPAPFTTLRTAIATINGLRFATNISLVGINGLEAFAQQILPKSKNVVVIWNAFGESAYYAIRKAGVVEFGWEPIDKLVMQLQQTFPNQPVQVCGQGLKIFEKKLEALHSNFELNTEADQFPKIELIAEKALVKYRKGEFSHGPLDPIYLKQAEPLVAIK